MRGARKGRYPDYSGRGPCPSPTVPRRQSSGQCPRSNRVLWRPPIETLGPTPLQAPQAISTRRNIVRGWLYAQVPVSFEAGPSGPPARIVSVDDFRHAPGLCQATGDVRGEIDDDVHSPRRQRPLRSAVRDFRRLDACGREHFVRHEAAVHERPQQFIELLSSSASVCQTSTVCAARYAFSANRQASFRRGEESAPPGRRNRRAVRSYRRMRRAAMSFRRSRRQNRTCRRCRA